MGTEILRPQDCFIDRIRGPSTAGLLPRRRNYYGSYNPKPNPNPCNYYNNGYYQNYNNGGGVKVNRKPAVRHERPDLRRHQRAQSEPSVSRRSSYEENFARTMPIARRWSADDLATGKMSVLRRGESLDSRGSSPVDVYAGSGFAVSPAPSSLPLPSFSMKKQVEIDDSATQNIKRLLRLEL